MTIPNEMKAIDIKEPGGPEMLVPVTVPIPELTSDQVLIKNEAVGVNRPDVAQRTGNYPVPPDANPLPGLEVAGEVVAMGSEAGNWEVGEKVTALARWSLSQMTKQPLRSWTVLPLPAAPQAMAAGSMSIATAVPHSRIWSLRATRHLETGAEPISTSTAPRP